MGLTWKEDRQAVLLRFHHAQGRKTLNWVSQGQKEMTRWGPHRCSKTSGELENSSLRGWKSLKSSREVRADLVSGGQSHLGCVPLQRPGQQSSVTGDNPPRFPGDGGDEKKQDTTNIGVMWTYQGRHPA